MSCIHCNALRSEIAELRISLGLTANMAERRLLAIIFVLQPAQSALLQALYDAAGKVVPRETLDSIGLTPEAYEDGSDALKVHMCKIRKKISADSVETVRGGYRMTDEGRALVYTALELAK